MYMGMAGVSVGRPTLPDREICFEEGGATASSTGRYTKASNALRTLSLVLSMLSPPGLYSTQLVYGKQLALVTRIMALAAHQTM